MSKAAGFVIHLYSIESLTFSRTKHLEKPKGKLITMQKFAFPNKGKMERLVGKELRKNRHPISKGKPEVNLENDALNFG